MNNKRYSLSFFLIPYIIFAITWFSLIIIYEKGELHLILNSYHSPFLDTFFKYFTELGGSIPFIIVAVYLFFQINKSFYLLSTLLINALLTNTLKRLFAVPRPKIFFEENFPDVALQFVDGVRIYEYNGFPSGHTSAVFATMICIALLSRNRYISVLCLLLAVIGAYSRVYLSQHFAEDIMLGSLVGMTTALAIYPLYLKSRNKTWMNKSILTVWRR
ncbi:MAG: phosphatase PAP2 family protein [Bacteroidia bacterium]|nr:phosphatase PAP2 family protein [Bacteroidia bacterium]